MNSQIFKKEVDQHSDINTQNHRQNEKDSNLAIGSAWVDKFSRLVIWFEGYKKWVHIRSGYT